MGLTKKENRFPELRELLNSATESERGIRVRYPTLRQAYGVLIRMKAAVGDSRRQSKEMFEPGDIRWGKSPYDSLSLSLDRPYVKDSDDANEPGAILLVKVTEEYLSSLSIHIEEL